MGAEKVNRYRKQDPMTVPEDDQMEEFLDGMEHGNDSLLILGFDEMLQFYEDTLSSKKSGKKGGCMSCFAAEPLNPELEKYLQASKKKLKELRNELAADRQTLKDQ